ncbi:MAG: glutamine--tRNA ligase/YqeY domain fusion protein [Thermodesulfobacteriota bacterium]
MSTTAAPTGTHFIRQIVEEDIRMGNNQGQVVTRFPPEPNGYLHIGHAKSICLNFGLAHDYGGRCHLRFDDTNPVKEEQRYIDSIQEDVHWLGYDWQDHLYYASDYFQQLFEFALRLIKMGKAYVCSLSPEHIRAYRGTLTEPGQESPYRNRSIKDNLDLFQRMAAGAFAEGEHVLRAKIDMASPNLNLRDPVIYRIMNQAHHRTGDTWHVYPTYDFAHGLSDSLEGITHSICTLEFEDHRPLYDWFLEQLGVHHPQQIEFARLNLNYTVMSKRKLLQLVEEGYVEGWDDPRMPTISGLRRRGFTPHSIRDFCERIGVAKANSMVDMALLEHCLREDLNKRAPRVMVVLDPIKVVITNYPKEQIEYLEAENNPEDETMGSRQLPFSREMYIERSDFREDPPKKYFRLAPGREVRLKHAYYITCEQAIYDQDSGELLELHCRYDPETKGGWSEDGRKVKGTLHWVEARHGVPATVRLYDRLFTAPVPGSGEDKDFKADINPDSLKILTNCLLEPGLEQAEPEAHYQFLRHGYYCVDQSSTPQQPVFNKTVALRDSWAKIEKKGGK